MPEEARGLLLLSLWEHEGTAVARLLDERGEVLGSAAGVDGILAAVAAWLTDRDAAVAER